MDELLKKINYLQRKINLKEWVETVVFALLFAFLFQTFLYQPFKIPSGSMEPGLRSGDYLFVEKFAYGYNNSSASFMVNRLNLFSDTYFYNKPQRGDVIVFLLPKHDDIYYIKRLIGLPGDEIQVKKGLLYVNGKAVNRKFKGKIIGMNSVQERDMYLEDISKKGPSYDIYLFNNANKYEFPNSTPIYKVPKDHYFFMGDNRDNSIDSRYLNDVGYVHQNRIVGKAKVLFWSSNFSFNDLFADSSTRRIFNIIK
ncbi:MAG: signal peptidase I [Candidatus Midichloriaceae bacterium]|jgi:signal peptidase I